MTWSTLPSYSDGTALTAAMVTAIKDNINESAPAKYTSSAWPQHFAGTPAVSNSIAAREIRDDTVTTAETTTSTTFVDLTTNGPAVTLTTGTFALVHHAARLENNTTGVSSRASFLVTGATVGDTATDVRGSAVQATANHFYRIGITQLIGVTAGSNTFTMKYRVLSNTGTFADRRICTMGL